LDYRSVCFGDLDLLPSGLKFGLGFRQAGLAGLHRGLANVVFAL
jgi:hypothetical protein